MSIYFDHENGGRPTIDKDPDSTLDYEWDLAAWLAPVSDTIGTVAWEFGGGLELDTTKPSGGVVVAAGLITAWIKGGTVGAKAYARCRVTTAAGRVDDKTLYFNVAEG